MSRLPPPPPKPGQVKVCRAVYNYKAAAADELSFEEGDLLYITDQTSSKDWWRARCGNESGLIPSNYVAEHTESIDNPMHDAAKRGNVDFLRELLANQVSVNGLDKAGATPLYWASHGGHLDCVQLLLDVPNCNRNSANKLGETPLHAAAWKGHAAVVELLLDRDADPKVANRNGKTPLDLATSSEVGALLKKRMRLSCLRAAEGENDYGDEEDSD